MVFRIGVSELAQLSQLAEQIGDFHRKTRVKSRADDLKTRVVKTKYLLDGRDFHGIRWHVLAILPVDQRRQEHRYWSIVESKRCTGGKVVQRPVL